MTSTATHPPLAIAAVKDFTDAIAAFAVVAMLFAATAVVFAAVRAAWAVAFAALAVLPDDKRDIVLLAYFLDMTDQEIADKLDMVRRTVQYKRAQSLKELKKEMEVTEDGAQSE